MSNEKGPRPPPPKISVQSEAKPLGNGRRAQPASQSARSRRPMTTAAPHLNRMVRPKRVVGHRATRTLVDHIRAMLLTGSHRRIRTRP